MRFGLIIPSSNTTMETEFWKMAMGWATVHTARMKLREITLGELEEMEKQMLEAAERLADAKVDVIGYGCTSGSLFRGKDHDVEIERKIREKTGIPAVATAGAVVKALKRLQVNKVCVATPYTEEINELERRFLEENGIKVLRIKGLGIVNNIKVGVNDPKTVYDLVKEVYTPETQGIFISCTNLRTVEVIDRLESELGVSVVSSNTATFWYMMRRIGIMRRLKGYGSLLRNY